MSRVIVSGVYGREKTHFFTEFDFTEIDEVSVETINRALSDKFGCPSAWINVFSVAVVGGQTEMRCVDEIIEAITDFCDGLDSMMNNLSSEEIADRLMETVLNSATVRQGGCE